jgi:hypothetical protein
VALDDDHYPKSGEDRSNKNPQRQVPNGSLRFPDVTAVPAAPGSNDLEAGCFRQLTILGSPGIKALAQRALSGGDHHATKLLEFTTRVN